MRPASRDNMKDHSTPNAGKWLKQLCNHLAPGEGDKASWTSLNLNHKIRGEFSDTAHLQQA